ncbi:MAG: dynamin family protein [Myxococcota bacterium]
MGLFERVTRFIDDVLLLPDDVRRTLDQAEDALEAGAHDEAELLFERVLLDRPTLARALVGLGQARDGKGDIAEARAAVRKARELEPDDPEVALFDARLSQDLGDFEGAARAAREAAARWASPPGPDFVRACEAHALAERSRNRPDRAARELRKALAVEPSRLDLHAELVEVLVAAASPAAALTVARSLDVDEVPEELALRIGLALHASPQSDSREVAPWLRRGRVAGQGEALHLLAEYALEEGDLAEAERLARSAIAAGGGSTALRALGRVALRQGNPKEAAEAFLAAARNPTREGFEAALRVAPLHDVPFLSSLVAELEPAGPAPAIAAVEAWIAEASGHDAALALPVESAEPRAQLARAAALLRTGDPAAALLALDAHQSLAASVPFAEVDAPVATDLRRRAYRALWSSDGDVDLAAAIDAVRTFAEDHDLTELELSTQRLREELDRPLLLAIMGEFNAGKSTFINAFVGADVAPTGIVPTTATLNVLRGGAERRVRVVYRNGSTAEGDYDDLKRLLREAEEGAGVDRVEIVLPSETLERVWILDTPGMNAIDRSHTELAQEALRRADAVIWIFDAGQAGKATEGAALREMHGRRRPVIPVVNKVDRLKPGQREEIVRALDRELRGLPPVSMISARQALRGRTRSESEAAEQAALEESGFAAFLVRLETDVFARSRSLKRLACAGRLLRLVEVALRTEEASAAAREKSRSDLAASRTALEHAAPALERALDEAAVRLDADLDQAYQEAAAEVLAFARPRRNRFARNGADREDRAFLFDVLERRLGIAADHFEARLVSQVRAALVGPTRAIGLSPALLDGQVRSAIARPLAVFVGLQRGILRGGGLHRFFEKALPQLELSEENIALELQKTRCEVRTDLRQPLSESLGELLSTLESARQVAGVQAARAREKLRRGTYAPLEGLAEALTDLREQLWAGAAGEAES